MRSNRRIFPQVGVMYYPRKRSGSMPAEPVRPRHILGGQRLRRAMLITHRVVLAKRVMRATMPRILGAFSICTEMSGSGRRTGTELTVREHRPIPQVRHRAPPVLFGAGLGAFRHGPAFGLPPQLPPSNRYDTSAFVSVSNSSELGTEG